MKKILLLILSVVFTNTLYSQTVPGNATGIIDSVVIVPIACNGDATSVTVYTSASVTSNVSYDLDIFNMGIWMDFPGYPFTAGNSFLINNLTAGTKRVIIEFPEFSGLFDTLVFFVDQPDAIFSILDFSNITCNGLIDGSIGFTTFLGTEGYFYELNGSAPQYDADGGSFAFNNLSPGPYTVNIKDVNNCPYPGNPISITLTQPNALTASIQQTTVSCLGGNNGTATVSPSAGTGPYSYSWSNSQNTQTATGLVSGNYTCTVTDANNCTVSKTIFVSQPSSTLTASIQQTPVSCFGGNNGTATVSPSAGTGPYSYSWSNSQNTQTATGLVSGNYTSVQWC